LKTVSFPTLFLVSIIAFSVSTSAASMAGSASNAPISRTGITKRSQTSPLETTSFDASVVTFSDDEAEGIIQPSQRLSSLSQRGGVGSTSLAHNLKIGFYFGLWYALNVCYNIVNKKVLNVLPAPLTVGTIQFGIGALYASLLWITGLRATPKLTAKGKEICWKVGFYHSTGQLFTMISLGAAPVSFTHIVKALEPFFSALVSALVFGTWMKPQVYATLIPVVGGVGYACLKERHFSWLAFGFAMASNLAFALRAVMSKSGMNNYIGENMNSVNLFAAVTIAAFILSIPLAFALEKTSILGMWDAAVNGAKAVTNAKELTKSVVLSGLFHYLNNEVMYLALSNVHPVTLAVGNTMKRVFIMVASVIVFRNPVSVQAGIGSAVGISGVLLYSLTKQYYEKIEAQEAAAAAAAAPKGRRGRGKN
jgi:solute carrier family 35 protein E1